MPTNIIDTVRSQTLHYNDRIGLNDQNQAQSAGRQHFGNIFARAWDCITRSSDQVQKNKDVAQAFVQEIKGKYGDQVAAMASRELKSHLELGRPLTAYRVAVVVNHATEMRNQISAKNDGLLADNLEAITEKAVKGAFGDAKLPDFLHAKKDEVLRAMDRAIAQDPQFSRVDGSSDEPKFIKHCATIGQRFLERAALEVLTPSTMELLAPTETRVDPDRSPHNLLQGEWRGRLHLPEKENLQSGQALVMMTTATQVLVDAQPEIDNPSHGMLLQSLGYLEGIRAQITELTTGEAWQDLSENGEKLRQAMLADLGQLETRFSELLGLTPLNEESQEFVISANRQLSEIEFGDSQKEWPKLANNLEQRISDLEETQRQLTGEPFIGEQSTPLLDDMRQRCTEALDNLRQFRDELELGEKMDVPPSVVAELRNADCPINAETLQRVNAETGFQLKDLQWLSGQGLSVGDTLMAFTPDEVALLREADLGVKVGLQYKERDIPIHPRTLVGDYTDSNIQGKPEPLRGGSVSTPFAVDYQLPTGEVDQRVFKEAHPKEGFGLAAKDLGIDPEHPQMTVRNIATGVVDELLGFNLVPDTRIGMMDGKLGMVMSFAHGAAAITHQEVDVTDLEGHCGAEAVRSAKEDIANGIGDQSGLDEVLTAYSIRITEEGRLIQSQPVVVEHNFNDPALRRELVKLQLLDALTAQGDRHGGNYVVLQGEDGRISLQAIDNDQAFGTKFDNPNDLWKDPQRMPTNFKAVKLPPVVDQSMVDAFSELSPEQLRGELAGLLPEAEIEHTVERLKVIQEYLTSGPPPIVLPSDGPEDWGTEQVGQLLTDPATSYVGRELDNLQYIRETGGVTKPYEETAR
ncbi:MAG: hypothetical protein QG599_291 [Pseudomonadota bacterium]|nr:hypothetical protein [Pseudomonadota bacterium]